MTYASEVLADSPLLYWRLGESSGTVAADATGNGRAGTYAGSPTLGAAGLLSGDADTAVQFDGSNDVVTYADTTDLSNLTIEAWVKTNASGERYIASRWNSLGTEQMFILMLDTTSKPVIIVRAAGTNTVVTGPSAINDNNRHHLVATFNSTSDAVTLYVDGTSVATGTRAGNFVTADVPFRVGTWGGSTGWFSGTIDEIAMYPTVLSSTRVGVHYTAGTTVPTITVHPAKITSIGTVHAPAIVPYVAPVDGNINITAELAPATKHAACIQPDRSAEIAPARHTAGVNAT